MKQPKGFIKPGNEHLVCKLNKSLYGLKQASRNWNKNLTDSLLSMGFFQLLSEDCIYYNKNKQVYIVVYVDDLIITGINLININWLKEQLIKIYKVRDLGKAHWVLGIKLDYCENGIVMHQEVYSNKLLSKFEMLNAKSMSTPMTSDIYSDGKDKNFENNTLYRQVIGTLLFLSNCTRPDINFAVSYLSRFVENPKQYHWVAVKRILRYINVTKSLGLLFKYGNNGELTAYIDAAYANNINDRKSTSGFIAYYNGCPISWYSKKQQIVATSSTEAEYVALSLGFKTILYLRNILLELNLFDETKSIPLMEDNQATILMANNGSSTKRSKHIDVRYHFCKQQIKLGIINLKYCSTNEMVADMFTKPLEKLKFNQFVPRLGMIIIKLKAKEGIENN